MLNRFIGVGRNTKDGEYRTSENNITSYSNSIAITNNYKNKEGNYDAEFINYIAYRVTADYLSKYSKKGTLIQIEGRVHTRSYEKDNEKKYITEIVVESASVLDKKESTQEVNEFSTMSAKTDYEEKEIVLEDSDLPF